MPGYNGLRCVGAIPVYAPVTVRAGVNTIVIPLKDLAPAVYILTLDQASGLQVKGVYKEVGVLNLPQIRYQQINLISLLQLKPIPLMLSL